MGGLRIFPCGLCVLLYGCAATPPPRPAIEFHRLVWKPETEYEPPCLVAEFQVINHGDGSLWYTGYGGKPLARAWDGFAGQWLERPEDWLCGNGLERCELRPGRSVAFALRLWEGEDAVRSGVRLSADREREGVVFWSGARATGEAPEPPAVSVPDLPRDRARELLHAARIGYARKARAILAAGVDVNARPGRPDGRTPCPYPGGGWAGVESNWTALHAAAEGAHGDVVEMLMAAGAEVDADDGCGGTPLVYATTRGDYGSVRALLAGGADPDAVLRLPDVPDGPDGLRRTPLHIAAESCSARLTAALIAAGADVNARDGRGRTPLDVALAGLSPEPEVAELLRAAGGRSGQPVGSAGIPAGHSTTGTSRPGREPVRRSTCEPYKTPLHNAR